VVKAGDIVKVRVLEVDVPRKRIALTRRLDGSVPPPREPLNEGRDRSSSAGQRGRDDRRAPSPPQAIANSALAAAFARAKKS
jgi:protein Tex